MRKEELKGILKEYRFRPIDEGIFVLLDEFQELCERDGEEEDLALSYFLRGEACFRMGIYEGTVNSLNKCLVYHTGSKENVKLEMSAYNLLGLIFSFMGYEVLALENYFYSLDISIEHDMYAAQAVAYINIGWLYRDLGDYEKAMGYYELAFKAVEKGGKGGAHYSVEALCYAYKGQLYYKMGEYEKAVECLEVIQRMDDTSLYYEVSVENLCLQVYHHQGDIEKVKQNMASLIRKASSKEDFLECFEFYADACSFAMEKGMKEEARQLIDGMEHSARKLNLAYVQLRLKRIEVHFQKKYSTQEDYLSACENYVAMQQEYLGFINRNKLVGMHTIENFRRIKKEKDTYKQISRHDEMTGLLNKSTLERLVSRYLGSQERNEKAALIIVDLDHFKEINDTAGHLKGDMVIKNTADKIKELYSQFKYIGRVGGDEFAIFIREGFSRENIIARAEELCKAVKQTDYSGEPFSVSVSIGIAFLEPGITTYEELFDISDKAMYRAKGTGRGKVYVGN